MVRSTQQFGKKSLALVCTLALLTSVGCKRDPNVRKQRYLESGINYEKEGKYQEATIQISNALKIDPNFAAAHYELAKTYLNLGTPMVAYQELMKTVDLQPTNLKARIDLGQMLLGGGVPDRAMEQVKAVLASQPENADAFSLRAGIEEKKGDHAAALADIQHALSIDPNRANFHAMLAVISSSLPQQPGAKPEEELQKAISLDPNNPGSHTMLATLLERKGDKTGAEQQDIAAVQAAPKSLEARATLAGFYLRSGDNAKAEATLKQAATDMSDKEAAPELLRAFYGQTKQLDRAVQTFAELSRANSKSVPLQLSYARALMQKGDFTKAQEVVADLSKVHSQSPPVETLNAILLVRQGKNADALALVHKAIKGAPENLPLQLMLAQLEAQAGNSSGAETAFREAARLDPSNLEAQSGLAMISMRRGDSTLLAQVANNTISLHPDYANAYLWRGTAEANQEQYEQAEADFQTALKKEPNNPIALTELGQLRLRQKRVPEAKAFLEQALQKDPNATHALDLLIAMDLGAKQPEKAMARVQQQIERSPNNAVLFNDRAVLQLGAHDNAGAVESARTAMKLDPTNIDAVQTFSQALAVAGQSDQAIGVWEKWNTDHPKDPRAAVMLGTLQEAKGDVPKATAYYKQALQLNPNNPIAANNLAFLMVDNGESADVALSYAQTARRGLPNSPSTADTLAWVYYHKAAYASARDLLEDAVKTDPNSASAQYHLGMTYLKLNDKAKAQIHLKAAQSADPASKAGQEAAKALSLAS